MKAKIRNIFIVIAGIPTLGLADDFIALRDGINSKTTIKDTSGCYVSIERNQKVIQIGKEAVNYIVFKGDTISYLNYKCLEAKKTVAEKKEEKKVPRRDVLSAKIDKYSMNFQKHLNIDTIFFHKYPIQEFYNKNWFDSALIAKTFGVIIKEITYDELTSLIKEHADKKIAIIYSENSMADEKNWGGGTTANGIPLASGTTRLKYCYLNFKIIYPLKEEILYDHTAKGISTMVPIFNSNDENVKYAAFIDAFNDSIKHLQKAIKK